jgi:predicted NBD/HSP70 family sugar kinase
VRIGVDVGGSKTAGVLADDAGLVGPLISRPTGYGVEEVLKSVVTVINQLQASADDQLIDSVGVGIPGAVDCESGVVLHAVNLGLARTELGTALTELTGLPVRVENDVKAAALGAAKLIEHEVRGRTIAYINLGTGLGAALVIDGELVRGSHGVAGEIGHIPVGQNQEQCHCGQSGCLELVASGGAIARRWTTTDPIPARDLFARAGEGDAAAIDIRDWFLAGVACAIRLMALTADAEEFILGGGVAGLGDPLILGVRSCLDAWSAESPFLASLDLSQRVHLLPTTTPAAAYGASLVGLRELQRAVEVL